MVSHCFNPKCRKPLLYLREGKIYVFELRDPAALPSKRGSLARRLEHFWLCGPCSEAFRMEKAGDNSVRVIAKPPEALSA